MKKLKGKELLRLHELGILSALVPFTITVNKTIYFHTRFLPAGTYVVTVIGMYYCALKCDGVDHAHDLKTVLGADITAMLPDF